MKTATALLALALVGCAAAPEPVQPPPSGMKYFTMPAPPAPPQYGARGFTTASLMEEGLPILAAWMAAMFVVIGEVSSE